MSEQEKKDAIPTEGTVTDVQPKESKIRKWIDNHPKAVKWAKRIGIGAAWIGSTALAYLAGGMAKGSVAASAYTLAEANAEDNEEEDDDILEEEEPAE